MSCYGAKRGDKIIGNKLADTHYKVTKTGWIGVVEEKIDDDGFWAKDIETGDSFPLLYDYFDFYVEYTSQILAKELGF